MHGLLPDGPQRYLQALQIDFAARKQEIQERLANAPDSRTQVELSQTLVELHQELRRRTAGSDYWL